MLGAYCRCKKSQHVAGHDDYSPPAYSEFTDDTTVETAADEEARHEEEANDFVARQAVTLQELSEMQQDAADTPPNYALNLSDVSYAASIDPDSFDWVDLSESQVDFAELVLVGIGRLTSLLVLFDYIWRSFQSYRTVRRFWSRSGVRLPIADLRLDGGMLALDKQGTAMWLLKYAWLASATASSVALLIAFVVAFCVIVTAAYVPFYREYHRGCVEGATNGTFLAANLYSVAYNYASIEGSGLYSDGIVAFDAARSDACAHHSITSVDTYNAHTLELASYVDSYATTGDDVAQLRACVDLAVMDTRFAEACCGLPGYDEDDECAAPNNGSLCPRNSYTGTPYLPVGASLDAESCWAGETWSLVPDAQFDCEALPLCATTCEGPNKPLLETVTERCACVFEYFVHSHCLRFAIAVCTYLLMNLSRFLAVRAGCKLMWRQLTPGMFDCLLTSDVDGNIVLSGGDQGANAPSAVANPMWSGGQVATPASSPDAKYRRAIHAQIDTVITKWEWSGWLELALALLLNVPWIVFCQSVKHHKTGYTP